MPPSLVIEFFEDSHWLGGSIYIDNLLAALSTLESQQQPSVRLLFLSNPNSALAQRLLLHDVLQSQRQRALPGKMEVFARRLLRAAIRRFPGLNALVRAAKDEVFFPAFDVSQRWRKNLYWIPDFQHHYLPALFSPAELQWRDRNFSTIAQTQGVLLLSSQAALADFRSFYPNATVQPRVWSFCSTISPGSVAECRTVLATYQLPEKFLYVANQFWRHKDHTTLFEALRLLKLKGWTIPVVCTGRKEDRRDPNYFPSLLNLLAQSGLQDQVYFLDIVPRSNQIQLFRTAAAVVQPSRFEGWSTVIEDAKALGRPIIASDLAVHREQLQAIEDTWLFKTSDPEDLARCLAEVWPSLRAGPDLERESSAAADTAIQRAAKARQFMAIVNDAMICSTYGRLT